MWLGVSKLATYCLFPFETLWIDTLPGKQRIAASSCPQSVGSAPNYVRVRFPTVPTHGYDLFLRTNHPILALAANCCIQLPPVGAKKSGGVAIRPTITQHSCVACFSQICALIRKIVFDLNQMYPQSPKS